MHHRTNNGLERGGKRGISAGLLEQGLSRGSGAQVLQGLVEDGGGVGSPRRSDHGHHGGARGVRQGLSDREASRFEVAVRSQRGGRLWTARLAGHHDEAWEVPCLGMGPAILCEGGVADRRRKMAMTGAMTLDLARHGDDPAAGRMTPSGRLQYLDRGL